MKLGTDVIVVLLIEVALHWDWDKFCWLVRRYTTLGQLAIKNILAGLRTAGALGALGLLEAAVVCFGAGGGVTFPGI